MTTVDLNNLAYADEPFVLANDAAQVFHVKDMSTKPRKRKDKEAITSYDEPNCHIVLSGKRNIVGVEDKTDISEDYEKFHEIPPFTVKTDPSILLNDEDCPWLRRKGTHAKKIFYTPRSHSGMLPASPSSLSSLVSFRTYLESPTSEKPEGIFVRVRVYMCVGILALFEMQRN